MKKYISVFIFVFLCAINTNLFAQWSLSSPNDKIVFALFLNKGELSYQVFGKTENAKSQIIESSSLGITRADQKFDKLTYIGEDAATLVNDDYSLVVGKRLNNKSRYKKSVFHFKNTNGSPLDIAVRVYDEGLGFKYVFPNKSDEKYSVKSEKTSFNLPNGNAWMTIYGAPYKFGPAYENSYLPTIIGTSTKGKSGWSFPALFNANGYWTLITEANVGPNFYGSHISKTAPNGNYTLKPPMAKELEGIYTNVAESILPWDMPWRVVIIGKSQGDILESNLVYHFSDPAVTNDIAWIKPGRSSWAWWSGFVNNSRDTVEKLKHFIDFAQHIGWEYSLLDANWDTTKGVDIVEMVSYANQRNVKLLLWYNSGGAHNTIKENPRNLMEVKSIRRKEMKRIADIGIKGIKVDFFSSEKQSMMALYHDILIDALDFKLMVNFHGCTLPKGWARSYPNLVTQEAVQGGEAYIWVPEYNKVAHIHNSILPFTRNVVGSMDYTPVSFSPQKSLRQTTYCHELALSVLFESGIIHYTDFPEVYKALPADAFNFLKSVPSVWDDTKYVYGTPGKEVILARRSGENWFLGGVNAERLNKPVKINFSFLESGKKYKATIINDGDAKDSLISEEKTIDKSSSLLINFKEIGGIAIKIERI